MNRPIFPAHEYDASLQNFIGPQEDWRSDLERAVQRGSMTVIIHGMIGSGKSRLIELLTGMGDNTISAKGPTDTGGFTEYSRPFRFGSSSGNFLCLIDTPGFGVTAEHGQERLLRGISDAIQAAQQSQAPLKRIYFMLDWNKDRNQVPQTLVSNLKILSNEYSGLTLSRIKFIVSKFDYLQLKRERIAAYSEEVRARYRQCFQSDLAPDSILFLSAGSMGPVCIRQLTEDLAQANEAPIMSCSPRSLKALPEVNRLKDYYQSMNIAAMWYFVNTIPFPRIDTTVDILKASRDNVGKGEQLQAYLCGRIMANQGKMKVKGAIAVAAVAATVAAPVVFPVEAAASFLIYAGMSGVKQMTKTQITKWAHKKLLEKHNLVKRDYEALCQSCL